MHVMHHGSPNCLFHGYGSFHTFSANLTKQNSRRTGRKPTWRLAGDDRNLFPNNVRHDLTLIGDVEIEWDVIISVFPRMFDV